MWFTIWLQIKSVSPSFHNTHALLHKIDSLLTGSKWECVEILIKGEGVGSDGVMVTETVELWCCNPLDCIKELLLNPAFKDKISYKPRKMFMDELRTERVYGEMWEGDWWWTMQVHPVQLTQKNSLIDLL